MNDKDQPEEVGSLGEEARRLLDVLADLAGDQGDGVREGVAGLAGVAARAVRQVDDHVATGAPECEYCPVCRTVHVVRAASPEVRAHLASAASSLLQAAAGWMATAAPEPRRTTEGVEHIGLDEDVDDGGWDPDGDDADEEGGR